MNQLAEGSTRTLADRVFTRLQDDIVRGEIPPGSKVSETELAGRYGVSRGPLREAIRRLESRKLLEREVHVGTRVASLSFEDLIEIYYVREALEGQAARLAAERMTDQEVAGLHQVLAQHEQQQDIREDTAYFQREGDLDFHYRIIQGSHNRTLIRMLIGELYHLVRMYRYQFSTTANRPQKALHEHRRIIEAIESRDAEMAELLMRRHISRARENIEQQAQRSPQ
ncbi:GntR family transcriptional regulator [Alloalcanivorax profundimaris]|uniref:GntR family transcriptional regulator n=1 Tax=Alloalcanivorax profundimaris TaxID=2735259 RepID=UPI000C3AC1C4|nr:GntR family transcriptional regulator [Alloalcanivorax profundimaris]MAO59936.1 GntR family transcriptional regulator [Alcanivorax sp.]MBM1144769.1 GntR family transcriptional regulator [Alcanivorax sp. ZXX171]QJX01653.1 GntR family transcriptional regulator [Alcanivorax sp. IO_7]UWN47878.1 putative D-xylose utilization operon transcriptional repressor [Alcanivorax sp. ALC70]MAY10908.1 GntR family transcriptional regulator [Alcanivorax sp.]|tara:strand:+ start:17588 stop:18265 length:678 start_codon:yes stop_codon:yes gene_type:complete